MPPVGFEPTISAGERPKAYALDRAATGTGSWPILVYKIYDPQYKHPDEWMIWMHGWMVGRVGAEVCKHVDRYDKPK